VCLESLQHVQHVCVGSMYMPKADVNLKGDREWNMCQLNCINLAVNIFCVFEGRCITVTKGGGVRICIMGEFGILCAVRNGIWKHVVTKRSWHNS
jgi:hypothetical protein